MAENVVYINTEEGLSRLRNNTGLFAKLLRKFLDDTNLKQLEDTVRDGDIENAKIAVHTLKGIAANLSLTELCEQCLKIETLLKAGSVEFEQLDKIRTVQKQTIAEIEKFIGKYGQ